MESTAVRKWLGKWRRESRRFAEQLAANPAVLERWRALLAQRFVDECVAAFDPLAVAETSLCLSLLLHTALAWEDAAADDPIAEPLAVELGDSRATAVREALNACPVDELRAALQWKSSGGDPLEFLVEQVVGAIEARRKKEFGVYFTPAPISDFLVRSATDLVSSGGVQAAVVIDPACGAGSFLARQLEQCSRAATGVSRLIGYEVLPANWAAAQVLLQRRLRHVPVARRPRLEVRFGSSLAVREPLGPGADAKGGPLLVVGNPPYANFGRRNRDPWTSELLLDYKRGLTERKLNLNDDFIKFIRWAQYQIEQCGVGVLAFVTSNTYLRGLTHRGMRRSLRETFDELFVMDLHGSSAKGEVTPDGSVDENVFGIRQGVALSIFLRRGGDVAKTDGVMRCAELWGSRTDKLAGLRGGVLNVPWKSSENRYDQPFVLEEPVERSACMRLDELFVEYSSGVQTKRDALFVDLDAGVLKQRIQALLGGNDPDAENALPDWLRDKLDDVEFEPARVLPYQTAPFDRRWIYYEPRLLGRSRYGVMRHLLQSDNLGMVFMRQSTNPGVYDHFLVTDTLVSDRVFFSAHGAPFLAPLYLDDGRSRQVNLSERFLQQLGDQLQWKYRVGASFGSRVGQCDFGEEDVLGYVYALFFSTAYRRQFASELKVGFPPAPIPATPAAFARLSQLGRRLISLHLWREPLEPLSICGQGDERVSQPYWDGKRVYLNATQYFETSVAALWEWRIGGYTAVARWLHARRNRVLTIVEQEYFGRLLRTVEETIRVSQQIDSIEGPTWSLPA